MLRAMIDSTRDDAPGHPAFGITPLTTSPKVTLCATVKTSACIKIGRQRQTIGNNGQNEQDMIRSVRENMPKAQFQKKSPSP